MSRFAYLLAEPALDVVFFFFAVLFAAFFVIGISQQISSHVLQPQGSSTQTTIPHSSHV
jgi:hypothetical protein